MQIADLSGLGAYLACDISDHRGADEHTQLALSAATVAGNAALDGHTLVRVNGPVGAHRAGRATQTQTRQERYEYFDRIWEDAKCQGLNQAVRTD